MKRGFGVYKRWQAFATELIDGKVKTNKDVTAERCCNLAKKRINKNVKEEKRRLTKATAKFIAMEMRKNSEGNSNFSTAIITSQTL